MKKGYKGFNADWTCRGKRYEVGKTYTEGEARLCVAGMHFCEYPLDVLRYFPLRCGSGVPRHFAKVEAERVSRETDGNDTKRVCRTLTVKAEIGVVELATEAVKYIKEHAKTEKTESSSMYKGIAANAEDHRHEGRANCSAAASTGHSSIAANTGDYSVAVNEGVGSVAANAGNNSVAVSVGEGSVAANAGDYSVSVNTGRYGVAANAGYGSVATSTGDISAAINPRDYGMATSTGAQSIAASIGENVAAKAEGNESIALAMGYRCEAAASLGSWIVLAEWGAANGYHIIDIKCVQVDGKTIKPDTFYRLIDGKFVEANNDEAND